MKLWHTTALAVLLTGCSGDALEVTRNDQPWSYQQVTEELHTGTGSTQLQIVLTDPGPPHVADAGGSYSVVVELDPSALEGTLPRTLEVNGAALFQYTDADPYYHDGPASFEAGSSNDPLILSAYLDASCFCTGPPSDVRQEVTGSLVLEARDADGTVHGRIDVTGDPIPTSFGDRVTVQGPFSAAPIRLTNVDQTFETTAPGGAFRLGRALAESCPRGGENAVVVG